MDFEEIVKTRYAVKKFNSQKIEPEKIEKLKEIVRLAPSSFNLQPWKIKIVSDEQTKEKLMSASWNQPQINTCSHLLVFCAVKDVEGQIDKLEKQLETSNAPAQSTAAYIKMMRGFADNLTGGDKISWSQRQVYLAVENALLGAKALGFDSCPMEGFDPKEYARILGIENGIVPTCIVPIGYAADEPREKIRFSAEEVFF